MNDDSGTQNRREFLADTVIAGERRGTGLGARLGRGGGRRRKFGRASCGPPTSDFPGCRGSTCAALQRRRRIPGALSR